MISQRYTGFGMGFQDFDQDGNLDLYVAKGAVQEWQEGERFCASDSYAEPNHHFRGGRDGKRMKLELVDETGGTVEPLIGTIRRAAFGDIDVAGDIVVVDRDARVELLRNVSTKAGSWIGFRVVYEKGHGVHDAGVTIDGPEGRRPARRADPAYSYLASNDPRVQFGLGALEGDEATGITVRWPDGLVEHCAAHQLGAYHELQRGRLQTSNARERRRMSELASIHMFGTVSSRRIARIGGSQFEPTTHRSP